MRRKLSLQAHGRDFSLVESHGGTWTKEVLISFLKRYFFKIWCFTDHNQCCQFYRWPTSAFWKAVSKDSSQLASIKQKTQLWGRETLESLSQRSKATTHMLVRDKKEQPPSKVIRENQLLH